MVPAARGDLLGDLLGLNLIGFKDAELDVVLLREFQVGLARNQRLLRLCPLDVICHKPVRGGDDSRWATVIRRELDQLRLKIGAEALDLPETCSVPLVDNLVVVGDRKHVFEVVARHRANEPVLAIVRVLKLVQQPIRIGPAIAGGDGGECREQAKCLEDERVEVEDVQPAQFAFVSLIGLRDGLGVSRAREARHHILGFDQQRFHAVDQTKIAHAVRAHVRAFQCILKHCLAVIVL